MINNTNESLLARRAKNLPRGVATAHPIYAAKASNAEIWDVEGRRYIDFGGGIGVQNFGHCHPKVVAAIQSQSERLIHSAFQVTAYESYIELAEKLNARAPFPGPAKTIFFSTGAEAVENSVKIARCKTRRPGVISFVGGFHGRSLLAMTLTGKVLPYKRSFGPFPGGVFHAPFPMECHGVTVKDSLKGIEKIFKASLDPLDTAAIMIEPVQGEGGFYIAPPEFLRELRKICDHHGILLISDEVQCGYGRTGKLFAIEHSGVHPDIVTAAKSIAGGLPLSAVIGRQEVMDAPEPGGLGGTYAGNPLACAAGLAILEVIEGEGLLARSAEIGAKIKAFIAGLADSGKYPMIGEVRALGGMAAFELVQCQPPAIGDGCQAPDADAAKRLTVIALKRGLILLSCGVYANVIRILVPVTIPMSQLDEALGIIQASLDELAKG